MMKMIWILTLTLFIMSCGQPEKGKSGTSPVKTDAQKPAEAINKVSLSAQPDTLKLSALPDTLNIKMTNNTGDTVTTGLHYRLELFENNQWTEVSPKDMAFNDLGFSLRPGDSEVFVLDLFKDTIRYQAGRYRVIKYFLTSDYAKTKNSQDIYAEFTVR